MTTQTGGALDDLVIADFGRVLAGPYATMMLADLGAEVIKVERPGTGDDTRSWGPPWVGEESSYFLGVNRNKRSEAIDLSDPTPRTSTNLVARADVMVENFLPGTMDRSASATSRCVRSIPISCTARSPDSAGTTTCPVTIC